MRIVLLGATGFVGHHLLPELASAGHQCLVLCRYLPGCRDLALVPGVELKQVDVHDSGVLKEQLEGADAVINMVGILNESGRSGKGFRRVHVELTEKLIEACRETDVHRLLQLSALNAGKGDSHYLVSKGQAEDLIRQATDLDSTIIQPSVIFGENDSFFNRFAGLLSLMPVLPLACPQARLQPVWVGDVVKAMTIALEDSTTAGATLILVGPREYSLRELVEWTARTAGLKRRIVGLPDAASRIQGWLMDFLPGKPFSSDNYRSLQIANTSTENSLWNFGIRPQALESIVPGYLGNSIHQDHLSRFRKQAGR
ncbi:MAG: complex I NDUFA9 subunit family protein [Gammaproteobacteria bacterium]